MNLAAGQESVSIGKAEILTEQTLEGLSLVDSPRTKCFHGRAGYLIVFEHIYYVDVRVELNLEMVRVCAPVQKK